MEASVARYLAQLETAVRQGQETAQLQTERMKDRLARLDGAHSVSPRDERQRSGQRPMGGSRQRMLMRATATTGKDTGLVGCNMQATVNAKHHLVVAHEVTSIDNGHAQLSAMAG